MNHATPPSAELYLRDDFQQLWAGQEPFAAAFALGGTVFRKLEQRQTLAFTVKDQCYFIKRHKGTTWKEILKNWLQLRLPVVSARNEFRALNFLQQLGIKAPTVVAYGRRGWLPSALESFLVTEDVGEHVSLEDHCRHWVQYPPAFTHKRNLIKQLAHIARTMHSAGICHRDFYLCHFLLTGNDEPLTVIDLHRALIKDKLAERWVVKDLGGLYFSAMDCGLTKRDLLRFIKLYRQQPLRQTLVQDAAFWARVSVRAEKLYGKGRG
jgi:heptose I phosphotransferase